MTDLLGGFVADMGRLSVTTAAYSIFGIAVDRSHDAKWLFFKKKPPFQCPEELPVFRKCSEISVSSFRTGHWASHADGGVSIGLPCTRMPLIRASVAMQDFGNYLHGLDNRGSRTVEVQIAIRQCDPSRPYGFQLPPSRQRLQQRQFAHRSANAVAAGSNDQEVRIRIANFIPGDCLGVLPLQAQQRLAIRRFHQ